MTDIIDKPDGYGEQLEIDFTAASRGEAPADIAHEVALSPAYQELADLRDEAYRRRRSGAHAIAKLALAALLEGRITIDEHVALFSPRDNTREEAADEGSGSGGRALDWAERAAGERPEDH